MRGRGDGTVRLASIIINIAIFLTTLVMLLRCFREGAEWQLERGLKCLRYFTVLSNVFCAVAALFMAIAQLRGGVPHVVFMLKYVGTVAVTVTLATVFLFLGPSLGSYKTLLEGDNLYLHLIGPLLALLSFCLLEKRPMTFASTLWGMMPVLLYGAVYLFQVALAPEDRRWEDFYGFHRRRPSALTYAGVTLGAYMICVLLWIAC